MNIQMLYPFNRDTNIPDASVARRGTVVVLSLCEAAKREFGGFVQRVFRGFTSTIKLGVFEHPTVALRIQ